MKKAIISNMIQMKSAQALKSSCLAPSPSAPSVSFYHLATSGWLVAWELQTFGVISSLIIYARCSMSANAQFQ